MVPFIFVALPHNLLKKKKKHKTNQPKLNTTTRKKKKHLKKLKGDVYHQTSVGMPHEVWIVELFLGFILIDQNVSYNSSRCVSVEKTDRW